MKRFIISFAFIIAILISADANARVYYTFEKDGGKCTFNFVHGFFIGYNDVTTKNSIDPITKDVTKHVSCIGEGDKNCVPATGTTGSQNVSPGCTISTVIIEDVINNMITEIEDQILNNKKYEGNNTKKIQVTSIEGKECLIVFTASWKNCDLGNKGNIIIVVDEVKI